MRCRLRGRIRREGKTWTDSSMMPRGMQGLLPSTSSHRRNPRPDIAPPPLCRHHRLLRHRRISAPQYLRSIADGDKKDCSVGVFFRRRRRREYHTYGSFYFLRQRGFLHIFHSPRVLFCHCTGSRIKSVIFSCVRSWAHRMKKNPPCQAKRS